MKKTLLAALVLLVALTGSSCLIVDDNDDFIGYDFNGVWTFAFTGCQGQVGNITISQSGSSFVMSSSSGLVWYGSCDPFAGTFGARADGGVELGRPGGARPPSTLSRGATITPSSGSRTAAGPSPPSGSASATPRRPRDDMLIIRGVNLFPTQVEDLILKHPELEPYYTLEVTRPGNLDELTVHVEMGSALANGSQEARHAAARKLEHNVKAYIGISATVRLALPMGLERSVGKAKRIIDRRPKQ